LKIEYCLLNIGGILSFYFQIIEELTGIFSISGKAASITNKKDSIP